MEKREGRGRMAVREMEGEEKGGVIEGRFASLALGDGHQRVIARNG